MSSFLKFIIVSFLSLLINIFAQIFHKCGKNGNFIGPSGYETAIIQMILYLRKE